MQASVADGAALEEQPINDANVQQYEFIHVEKNIYLIKIKDKDLYITPADKDGKVNSQIILSKKDGSKLQQWTINEQHPTM